MCPNMYRDMTREEDNIDRSIPRIRIDEDGGFVADIRNQLAELELMLQEHETTQEHVSKFYKICIEQSRNNPDSRDLTSECIEYNNSVHRLNRIMTDIVNVRNDILRMSMK